MFDSGSIAISAFRRSSSVPRNFAGRHFLMSFVSMLGMSSYPGMFVVSLEEHHHFQPVLLYTTAVRHTKKAAVTEVPLDLSSRGLTAECLLRHMLERGKRMLPSSLPVCEDFAGWQLETSETLLLPKNDVTNTPFS